MKKIIVYNNWGDTPEYWINSIRKQSPNGKSWGDIKLVSDLKKADFIIVLDGAGQINRDEFDLFVKKPKIYLQREPEHVQGPIRMNSSKFVKFITYEESHTFSHWWLDCDYEFLSSLTYNQARIQKPICITTNKAFTHGQRQRLNFFKKIDNLIEIDFYGKNNISSLFRTYKGPPERSPEHPRDKFILRDYNVSFSIENGKRRNFFTRTQESMLCWTMPIYWGCPNLEDFFPEFSYRYVNIEEKITPEYLAHLTRPVEKNELLALEESRNLILRKYNFFPFIDNILKDL